MSDSEKDQTEKQEQRTDNKPAEDQKSAGSDAIPGKDEQPKEKTETEKQADRIAELTKRVEELTKENENLKDQVLRRAADFDNYRKRMLKEKQDTYDYANESLLQDLLDSLDNFDRTVDAAANAKDVKSIADGVKMISSSLVKLLEDKYNLSSYGNAGDKFNPDEHQAIGSGQGPVAEPVLKEVYLKGYKLKDKVIRHAKVMVTMPDGSVKADDKEKKPDAEPEKKQ
ncbi:MAG TPA: nucleotide exchange factor GrpE [Treponema sp.]|nr:nucleotide exchange factor GrpE [Treponema sp.]